jgi:hypothetical protein
MQLDEEITISLGPHSATIRNGKLTIGEKDCGTVKPGDTIKLTPDDRTFVNGEAR